MAMIGDVTLNQCPQINNRIQSQLGNLFRNTTRAETSTLL